MGTENLVPETEGVPETSTHRMTDSLSLAGAIGFSGKVKHSLILHANDGHIIYPLGSTIVIRSVEDQTQQIFLQAHTQRVTCMAISNDGNFLASGQITHMGYLADVILWDISGLKSENGPQPKLLHKLSLHKVMVEAVAFSCNGKYLASIGGEDDNNLVVWSVEDGLAICGSPASHDKATTVTWLNQSETALVTGGVAQLRVWDFDPANRKVRPTECTMGKEKRSFTSIAAMPDDSALFCGTTSGDIVKIDTQSKRLLMSGPRKRFQQGIHALTYNPQKNELLIGSGEGEIAILDGASLTPKCAATKVLGGVTSLALDSHGEFFFCGTAQSNIYLVQYEGLLAELKGTHHADAINDVAFPQGYADLFATCGGADIRVWHARTMSELLRIQVPNLECNCIAFPASGNIIVSGWSDGRIRSFGPQSGNLQYVINDAHKLTGVGNSSGGVVPKNGVTSICPSNDCKRIISGGADGKVRVWAVSKGQQVMLASMQEHKGPISAICIKKDDSECISASADGSCIVWALAGLQPYVRLAALFAANFFKSVAYFPDESQLITCGTDRKITYWDTDMNTIRIVDGSEDAEVNTLCMNSDGRYFVAGGSDKKVTLWNYDEGSKYYCGEGHSGSVTAVRVSPDEKTIISCGTEGGICIWQVPQDFC